MPAVSARLTVLFSAVTAAIIAVLFSSLYLWVRTGLDRTVERERAAVRDAAGTPEEEALKLLLARSEASRDASLRELRLYFGVFGPAFLAIAALLGHGFVRRALSPVEEIRRHAERISRESLSERIAAAPLRGEFRDLADTFNSMLDRVESAMQDLRNFASDAAHELRTPLANLRAEIETAVQADPGPEDRDALLASFAEEVSRMSQVVTDLLTLAQVDLRQYVFRKEPVSLGRLLEEVRETWQAPAVDRSIQIALEGPDATVEGDPVALRRVFMNLVENAVKYNRDGGRITLRIESGEGLARVRVRDTGIGIPAEHLPLLFRRFYRVDKGRSREQGGSGLGLAICRSFVEAQRGLIRVSSRPGEGTEFTVELPVPR